MAASSPCTKAATCITTLFSTQKQKLLQLNRPWHIADNGTGGTGSSAKLLLTQSCTTYMPMTSPNSSSEVDWLSVKEHWTPLYDVNGEQGLPDHASK